MVDDQEPTGKAKGGHARAEKLSPEERKAIASEAAKKRWENREAVLSGAPRALPDYKGELNLSGVKLPCAVIQGSHGIQRVLTETGITEALLGTRSGASKRLKKAGALLPLFVAPGQLKPYINQELIDGPLQPIDYLDGNRLIRGYDAAIL